MLDDPPPTLLCYSKESVIAEKLQAMVKLGLLNSRMKDFYDIELLSRQYDFEGSDLAEAIRITFKERGTQMPAHVDAFSDAFINTKQVQWKAFRKRLQREDVAVEFRDIVSAIEKFVRPIVSGLSSGKTFHEKWRAPGQWR
jgi:hypothetical protein